MQRIYTLLVCAIFCLGLYAADSSQANKDVAKEKKDKYTFGDFFDALDLPTVLGVGFTPNGIESATFNSAAVMEMQLRHSRHNKIKCFMITVLSLGFILSYEYTAKSGKYNVFFVLAPESVFS